MWALGGLCDRFLGEKFSNLFYELMEGDLSSEIRQELGITVQVSGVQVHSFCCIFSNGSKFKMFTGQCLAIC